MGELNHVAWAQSMIGFIRERGLEEQFKDWCGGWPCRVASADVTAPSEGAIRHDERKKIIAEGCIHTRKRDERGAGRADLDVWQAAQGEWFDPTMLEIVTEYAEWRDAQGAEVSDDDIIVLFQQGKKLDDIAQATGLPKSTVHARLKKHGLTQARRRIKWTANMRNELIGLRAIKVPMSTIAKRLKVSRSAIYAELARIERQ